MSDDYVTTTIISLCHDGGVVLDALDDGDHVELCVGLQGFHLVELNEREPTMPHTTHKTTHTQPPHTHVTKHHNIHIGGGKGHNRQGRGETHELVAATST